ncbi:MAG: type IV toxin-antitoxin system AbiEi family antitoxin domain-containing protein [Thermodesulfobacteriota bacterium]
MTKNNISLLLNTDTSFFTLSSLQAILNLTRESARTTASRLVERGILIRLRRDLYALVNRHYSLFSLANALHQPSVISLETALNYWGLIVQVPQVIFSISLRSYRYEGDTTEFIYRRIKQSLFRFGQVKAEDFYITEPEKALLDSLYMKSKGLVELLPGDVDTGKLDNELLRYYSSHYPGPVRKLLREFMEQGYEAK